MSDFVNTLRFLNLRPQEHEELESVNIWRTTFLVGNPNVKTNVLEIRRTPTLEQFEEAFDLIGPNRDYAIISTELDINRIKQKLVDGGFGQVSTVREVLYNGARNLLGERSLMELPRATIEPVIRDVVRGRVEKSTLQIADWLRERRDTPLAIITGPAGFGKTTLCQILVNRFLKATGLNRIPLYISSSHWQSLIEKHHVTIRSIFLEAVSATYSQAAIGEEMVEHLIAEGAIVPIFDGLDEICTDAYTEISIPDVIDQMEDMFEDSPNARALFTSRSTYWSTAKPSERLSFLEFAVCPFDEDQRARFLDDWFEDDQENKTRVKSILGKIETLGTSAPNVSDSDAVKFSESPYILRLASLAAEKQSGFGFGEESWADTRDPLDALLKALANRERRKTNISQDKQTSILFSTALLFGEHFSVDNLADVVSLYAEEGERLEGMLSHHLIAGDDMNRTFLFQGLADYIRAKAFSDWLFNQDTNLIGIRDYLSQLTSETDASVDIFGDISGFYGSADEIMRAFADSRVSSLLSGEVGQGLLFLFCRAMRKQAMSDHRELSKALAQALLSQKRSFNNLSFRGKLEGLSFSGFRFKNCKFTDVIIRNCDFDAESIFSNCEFRGDFAVYSSNDFSLCQLSSPVHLSSTAKAVFAQRGVKGADRKITESDIELLIDHVFSQMQTTEFRYRDISREGLISRAQKKNSYIAKDVIQALEAERVLTTSRKQKKHRARLAVSEPEDVIAFHKEGAAVGSVRRAMDRVLAKFS